MNTEQEMKHRVSEIEALKEVLRVLQNSARSKASSLSETLKKIGELELEIKDKEYKE